MSAGKVVKPGTGELSAGRGERSSPDWGGIVAALKAWRKKRGEEDPSVTTVAERYRKDPWAVLVSTILSLRTKDEVTLKTSHALLAKAPNPASALALTEQQAAALAYPAGFYKTKAANIRKIASIIIEKYGGRVPSDMDALLELPGVGRKTANLVLIEAYDKYGICVDIHVHRISNRTGWLSSKTPEETEMILRNILPKKFWKAINPLLVLYGQNVCRPLSPFCSRCVIKKHCAGTGVEKTR
ncbi:MAG: endonuclease III [Treponema sp.]|jgi:endonuclease-3|nr:endonuclease III [Treponema sp.]